ncbi:hypothetical protein OG21DRAFT_829064 [Imleria badia]|nr:hypothetical protein OG21DRAFT_829064 [Imleria badia]
MQSDLPVSIRPPISTCRSLHDVFAHVLKAGQSSGQANAPLLLDIRCCDLRYLVQSGYPSDSVTGYKLRWDFVNLGFELDGDCETCPIPFLVTDISNLSLCPFPQQADEAYPLLSSTGRHEPRATTFVFHLHAGRRVPGPCASGWPTIDGTGFGWF